MSDSRDGNLTIHGLPGDDQPLAALGSLALMELQIVLLRARGAGREFAAVLLALVQEVMEQRLVADFVAALLALVEEVMEPRPVAG